jgi:hypothetical protein
MIGHVNYQMYHDKGPRQKIALEENKHNEQGKDSKQKQQFKENNGKRQEHESLINVIVTDTCALVKLGTFFLEGLKNIQYVNNFSSLSNLHRIN